MNQNIFASLETRLPQRVMCGEEDLRYRSGSRPLEIRRYSDQRILMRRHKLSMRRATDDSHHAIAFTPAISVRAQLRDLSGKLQSRDVLRHARWRRISTRSLQKVGTIERTTAHAYQHFVRAGSRRRHVLNFQHLPTTGASNYNSLHD